MEESTHSENERGYYLIMEMIEGRSIPHLDQSTQWEIVPKLLRAVQAMHKRNIIHCDIKLSNFFESAGEVKILDFGSARSFDSKDEPILGTRNHMAPEAKSGKATAAYDIYSLGSCLEEIVLQCNPAELSSRAADRLRLVRLIGGEEISNIIDLCHRHKPEERPLIEALIEKVDRYCENRSAAKPLIHESSPEEKVVRARIRSAMRATKLYETRAGKTLCWKQSPADAEPPAEGIFTGASGILLAHLAAAVCLGTNRYDDDIERAANWLLSQKRGEVYPSLMSGSAGMALALGATYAYTCNDKLIKPALALIRHAAEKSNLIDLFAGKSGIIYAATTLYRLTKKEAFLSSVAPLVSELKNIRLVKNGVQVWPKSMRGEDNGEYFTGSAHGSAGIAMALALYGRAAGDGDAINIAKETFNSLYQFGTSEDRSMMVRNIGEVQKPCANAKYCHGTGGFLWSLLEAFPRNREFEEMADWAVGLLAKERGVVSPTYCHGLVGQLDLWRMIGNEERHNALALQNVQRLQNILGEMTVEFKGHRVWHGDDPETILPGLWVGFTGTAGGLCLALQKNASSFLSLDWISADAVGR